MPLKTGYSIRHGASLHSTIPKSCYLPIYWYTYASSPLNEVFHQLVFLHIQLCISARSGLAPAAACVICQPKAARSQVRRIPLIAGGPHAAAVGSLALYLDLYTYIYSQVCSCTLLLRHLHLTDVVYSLSLFILDSNQYFIYCCCY